MERHPSVHECVIVDFIYMTKGGELEKNLLSGTLIKLTLCTSPAVVLVNFQPHAEGS